MSTLQLTAFAECPEVETESVLEWAKAIFTIGREHEHCSDLNVGETVVIDRSSFYFPTESRYRITRTTEREFVVGVRLDFKDKPWLRRFLGSSPAETEQLYLDLAQECFDRIEKSLNGPAGEKMRIEILGSGQQKLASSGQHPRAWKIRFEKDLLARAHSTKWTFAIECPTVIHEVFHLLGLVDEYTETEKGFVDKILGIKSWVDKDATHLAYDCRALGPKDSIMSSSQTTYPKFLDARVELLFCTCPSSQPIPMASPVSESEVKAQARFEDSVNRCWQMIQETKANSADSSLGECPAGTETGGIVTYNKEQAQSDPAIGKLLAMCNQGYIEELKGAYFCMDVPPLRKSLLFPAQWRAILYPGCNEKNPIYNACAKNAYLTSKEHGGTGCLKDLPSECMPGTETNDNSVWLN